SVLTWDTHQFRNRPDRQRVSKVINDIELIAIPLRVKQFVHDLDHTVTHPRHSLGTELMYYHATEAVMSGCVEEQEGKGRKSLNAPRLLRYLSRGQFASATCTLAFVGTNAWIVQEGFDLSMRADYIGTIFLP